MSEEFLSTAVRSYSAGRVGRSMNSVRNHHVCQKNGATTNARDMPWVFQTPSLLQAIT